MRVNARNTATSNNIEPVLFRALRHFKPFASVEVPMVANREPIKHIVEGCVHHLRVLCGVVVVRARP
jgi:hypothetical protein